MKTYELWEKMIKGKVYSKEVATMRLTAISPLLTNDEFEALAKLIQDTYK